MPARRLSARELEARRLHAMRALASGKSRSEVALQLGASRTSVSKWAERYEDDGIAGLRARRRGRPPVRQTEDSPGGATLADLLVHRPDALGLPGMLWTQHSIRDLLTRRLGSEVSRWTVSRYCADWGLRAPQPLAALERSDEAAARRWFTGEYRALKSRLRRSHAALLFYEQTQVQQGPEPSVVHWLMGGRGDWSFLACLGAGERAAIDFFTCALQHFACKIAVIAVDAPLVRSERIEQWFQRHDGRAFLEIVPAP